MFPSAKAKQQKQVRQLQCQKQCIDHIPYYLSGLSRALFSDNLSRNSCIQNDTQSFIRYPDTEKWVEKRGAAKFFKTNFEVSGYRMKH